MPGSGKEGLTFEVELSAFEGDFSPPRRRAASELQMMAFLSALFLADRVYLRQHPLTPPLHLSRVIYNHVDDPTAWRDIGRLYAAGRGDCKSLACARAAELVESGEDKGARPVITAFLHPKERGLPLEYHVRVARTTRWTPRGPLLVPPWVEDPSEDLGMLRQGKGA